MLVNKKTKSAGLPFSLKRQTRKSFEQLSTQIGGRFCRFIMLHILHFMAGTIPLALKNDLFSSLVFFPFHGSIGPIFCQILMPVASFEMAFIHQVSLLWVKFPNRIQVIPRRIHSLLNNTSSGQGIKTLPPVPSFPIHDRIPDAHLFSCPCVFFPYPCRKSTFIQITFLPPMPFRCIHTKGTQPYTAMSVFTECFQTQLTGLVAGLNIKQIRFHRIGMIHPVSVQFRNQLSTTSLRISTDYQTTNQPYPTLHNP